MLYLADSSTAIPDAIAERFAKSAAPSVEAATLTQTIYGLQTAEQMVARRREREALEQREEKVAEEVERERVAAEIAAARTAAKKAFKEKKKQLQKRQNKLSFGNDDEFDELLEPKSKKNRPNSLQGSSTHKQFTDNSNERNENRLHAPLEEHFDDVEVRIAQALAEGDS